MYSQGNTISQTEAANLLGCLLPRVKRLIKEGVLNLVKVNGARYKRIPIRQVVKLLREELQSITMRQSSIKNSLMNLQAIMDEQETEQNPVSGKEVLEKWSFFNNPSNPINFN